MMHKPITIIAIVLALFSCSNFKEKKEPSYDELLIKGQSMIDKGELNEAVTIYEEAIKINKNRPEAYYNLGFIYTKKCSKTEHGEIAQDCIKAVSYFNKVIKIDSAYRRVFNNRAYCKVGTGQLKEALDDYNRQIEIDKSDPDYFQGRGWCKLLLHDTIGACIDYRHAIKLGKTEHEDWINSICPK